MNILEAIQAAREGKRVYRQAWLLQDGGKPLVVRHLDFDRHGNLRLHGSPVQPMVRPTFTTESVMADDWEAEG